MGRFIVVCIGLLMSIAAVDAWAVNEFPEEPRPNRSTIGDSKVYLPKSPPAAAAATATAPAPAPAPGNTPAPAAVLPDLRGKTCDQAQAELRRLHVALTECRPGQTRTQYPVGTINAQSIAPGTLTSRVDGLRVTVEPQRRPDQSPQSEPVPGRTPDAGRSNAGAAAAIAAALAEAIAEANARKLPDLRGKTCEQAQAELRPLRIALAECLPGSAAGRYAAGTINAQSPAPGTPASRTKELRARTEPLPPPPDAAQLLPDLRGMSCDQARATLRPLALALVECLPGKAGSRYPAGTISAQSQEPGTPLPRVDRLRARFEPAPAPPEAQRLPDLRGMTCEEAAAALGALDLRFTSCTPGVAVDGARLGRVNAQSPAAGTTLPLAGPIVLRMQPAPPVIVPELIGLGEAQASSALASRKLQARASGPAAAQGRRVLSQNPAAGTAVAPGSAVEFALGLGVPRLLDLGCAAARARAAEFGHRDFDCEARPADSPDMQIGRVFEQAPAPDGAALPAPAAIRVVVWAAQPVTVPDVRERALDDAIRTIEAAKLVAQPPPGKGERIVAQQAPAPGTVVDAGSAVKLDTREVVEVPDVVGQTLAAAQSTLQQARLRGAADAEDYADDRVVQSQRPAAHARVAADSTVQMSTKRFATVPPLVGLTCAEARAAVAAADTFRLACNDESSWRVTVFGTPHVEMQQPGAQARAEIGSTIAAEARAPLPPWGGRLRDVPLAAVAAVVAAPLLGFGLWMWLRPVPPPRSPPVPAPSADSLRAFPGGPLPVPPRAPTFAWRVAADTAPPVTLRWPSAGKGRARGTRHAAPEVAWRVVPDAGHVLLREFYPSSGDDHAER